MQTQSKQSFTQRLKTLIIGSARSPHDRGIFHKLTLIAFFAWVGLGADGLSSSCYGPQEAFLALKGHTYLGIFVALASALTIFVISASYSQIIELFPAGGGGYLVASKLLSPTAGIVSGCALLIDYVLTITVSIASGTDAIFSFLPPEWSSFKLELAVVGIMILTLLNLRGVKESTIPFISIFLIFIVAHAFIIVYAIATHSMDIERVAGATIADVPKAYSEIGIVGMIFVFLRAYSMGAGTYTGIEAVSNGLPILREPKVKTAKRTMRYMAISLSFTVMGLMFAYILYKVTPEAGKTLNATLFEQVTSAWSGDSRSIFLYVILVSEAALLFAASQTGFVDGPRVLASMALDRWFPTRFTMLSDRLVTQNGILLMGGAALATMLLTRGSVQFLVILYSINVFITFLLSQLGMVRHWWSTRSSVQRWLRKLLVNSIGLILTALILALLIVFKFYEGGWITLLVTGILVGVAIIIKRNYNTTVQLLSRLDDLVHVTVSSSPSIKQKLNQEFDPKAKTAVLLVNGFNGVGLHTLFNVIRLFEGIFKNFIFVQIGAIDAGNFKGTEEIERLHAHVKSELDRYVDFTNRHGYYAEGFSSSGIDVIDEVVQIASNVLERFPHAVFFGGQLVFQKDSFLSRWLHNYTTFAAQRRLYHQGIPFVIIPVRVY